MKTIDKLRKAKYKESRLQGESIAGSMIKSGYKNSTAYHDAKNSTLVKTCEREILEEFKAESITVKEVLRRINEDRLDAKAKGDQSTALQADIALGKYLSMFTERIEQHNINEEKAKELDGYLDNLIKQRNLNAG